MTYEQFKKEIFLLSSKTINVKTIIATEENLRVRLAFLEKEGLCDSEEYNNIKEKISQIRIVNEIRDIDNLEKKYFYYINKLTKYREVMLMKFIGGMFNSEIASALNIEVQTVSNEIQKALKIIYDDMLKGDENGFA